MPEPDHKTLARIRRAKASAQNRKQTNPQATIHTPTQPQNTDPSTDTHHKPATTPKTTTTELQRGSADEVASAKALKTKGKSGASVQGQDGHEDAEPKILRKGMARFEARLNAPGGVAALAGAIRRYVRRPDIAGLIPDETLAGMVMAAVKGGLLPGSYGTSDRAAFWRLVDAPWASPLSSAARQGMMTPEDAADMGKTIQDRVSAAIARAEASGRILAGRSGLGVFSGSGDGLTLDAVVDGEDDGDLLAPSPPSRKQAQTARALSGHPSPNAHFMSSNPGDDQDPATPDPAALRRQFIAARDAAVARGDGDRASLSWLDGAPTPPARPTPTVGDDATTSRRMRPTRRRSTGTDGDGRDATPSDPSWPR